MVGRVIFSPFLFVEERMIRICRTESVYMEYKIDTDDPVEAAARLALGKFQSKAHISDNEVGTPDEWEIKDESTGLTLGRLTGSSKLNWSNPFNSGVEPVPFMTTTKFRQAVENKIEELKKDKMDMLGYQAFQLINDEELGAAARAMVEKGYFTATYIDRSLDAGEPTINWQTDDGEIILTNADGTQMWE